MNYINGQWTQAQGNAFSSINPANNTLVWQGNHATEDDVNAACDAAHRALSAWSSLDVSTRANHLQAYAKHVEARRQDLINIIALESGKPLWEAATEVNSVIGKVALSIQAYQERTGEKQTVTADATQCLRFKPHGVVTVLGPFNFPAHLSNGHIVPALLAGNTVIYKPSHFTPGVAEVIMQCWHDSGLPAGVLNCVQGNAETAKFILKKDIQGVYFTGSYKTGVHINQQFSDKPEVILALEMGGNNPLVIGEVENTRAAVYNTLLSSFITAGQRCTCARRVMIPDTAMGDQFLSQLVHASKSIQTGPFTNQPEPFMGPVISHADAISHLNAQQTLQQAGGKSLLTMQLLTDQTGLLTPGIIDMTGVVNPPDEEIFAPFIQVHRYHDLEQAIALANQTRYGLAAGLFSDNQKHYQQFYQTVRAGLINWNRPTTGAASSLPFGGIGRSGNHRPSAWFAADYCAYPIASMEQETLAMPEKILPGIEV